MESLDETKLETADAWVRMIHTHQILPLLEWVIYQISLKQELLTLTDKKRTLDSVSLHLEEKFYQITSKNLPRFSAETPPSKSF